MSTEVIYKIGANGAQKLEAVSTSEDGTKILFRKTGAPSRLAAEQIKAVAVDMGTLIAAAFQQRGDQAAAYFDGLNVIDHSSVAMSATRHLPRHIAKQMCTKMAR